MPKLVHESVVQGVHLLRSVKRYYADYPRFDVCFYQLIDHRCSLVGDNTLCGAPQNFALELNSITSGKCQ